MLTQLTPACDQGLGAFTVEDLCQPDRVVEAVLAKINQLPAGPLAHRRLEQELRLLLTLLRDAVCGDYRALPLTALAELLQALHYFLKWKDRRPDTWEDGYRDDLEEVLGVVRRHRAVFTAYKQWLLAGQALSRGFNTPAGAAGPVQVIEIEFSEADIEGWRWMRRDSRPAAD